MTKPSNFPLTENEKQLKPLKGETSPEDAFVKARHFTALEKRNIKNRN